MPNALIALGGAFLVAGLLARLGRRIGLPTIPFFMAAGILTGPHTSGLVLVRDPGDLELFAAVGLIMLLFQPYRPKADLPTEVAAQRSENDRALVASRSVRLREGAAGLNGGAVAERQPEDQDRSEDNHRRHRNDRYVACASLTVGCASRSMLQQD